VDYSWFGVGYRRGLGSVRSVKADGVVVICFVNSNAMICDCISMKIFEFGSEMIAFSAVRLEGLLGLDGGCHAYMSKTPSTSH
jgi:hypothetical protein